MGPGDLDQALCGVELPHDPNVITGFRGSEDAGVYRLDEETALVQTLDFFTPVVDDPRIFGRAAAANSLSDVYAMGGRPLTAMNIVCFPAKKLGLSILRAILQGGLDILREAGVALVGGHSVEDDEPKYGLSVTGIVHPDRIMRNSTLEPGDRLILTKAIGTGLVATAIKAQLAGQEAIDAMVKSMCTLNRAAAEVATSLNMKACTDVTGFGLAGHLVEMARASGCRVQLRSSAVPILLGALDAASMGLVPGGAHANRKYFSNWTTIDGRLSAEALDLMFDPQTSGGLLLGVPASKVSELLDALRRASVESATNIGEVLEKNVEGRVEIV
jgi:selenide,water dikinase